MRGSRKHFPAVIHVLQGLSLSHPSHYVYCCVHIMTKNALWKSNQSGIMYYWDQGTGRRPRHELARVYEGAQRIWGVRARAQNDEWNRPESGRHDTQGRRGAVEDMGMGTCRGTRAQTQHMQWEGTEVSAFYNARGLGRASVGVTRSGEEDSASARSPGRHGRRGAALLEERPLSLKSKPCRPGLAPPSSQIAGPPAAPPQVPSPGRACKG